MKKFISLFVIPLLLVCSCDDWFGIDGPDDDSPGSYTDAPVDPVTPAAWAVRAASAPAGSKKGVRMVRAPFVFPGFCP